MALLLPQNATSSEGQIKIPDELLKEHADGKVIFFCGAGISMFEGLPSFKILVDKIYSSLSETMTDEERKASDVGYYDRALHLLEKRLIGHRTECMVREKIYETLTHNKCYNFAVHKALLSLSKHSGNSRRKLVTTNFDTLFEKALNIEPKELEKIYSAPLLPDPEKHNFQGIIYLHGRLPDNNNNDSNDEFKDGLNELVLTSGDFGQAYMTKGWATQFVTGLFKQYTVCFVGYSADDPVLRYILDAFSAGEMLGEQSAHLYAFSQEGKDIKESWKAKGVTPIFYPVKDSGPEENRHDTLRHALREWSSLHACGLEGKKHIVEKYCELTLSNALKGMKKENMLWALQDAEAALYFSSIKKNTPFEWLNILETNQLLCCAKKERTQDEEHRLHHLFSWMMRFLNNPALLLWIVEQDKSTIDFFKDKFRCQLNEIDNQRLAEDFKEYMPDAMPDKAMRTLWQLFLNDIIIAPQKNNVSGEVWQWKSQFSKHKLTTEMWFWLKKILSPRLTIEQPFKILSQLQQDNERPIEACVRVKGAFSSDSYHYGVADALDNIIEKILKESSVSLLPGFVELLMEYMLLQQRIGKALDYYDLSDIERQSITPHSDNIDGYALSLLIELVRQAWLHEVETKPDRAKSMAEQWWSTPFPVFKRLCFFAATQTNVIPAAKAVSWLLSDDKYWLWNSCTKREVILLLQHLAKSTSYVEVREEIETAILQGPINYCYDCDGNKHLFSSTMNQEQWDKISEYETGYFLQQLKKAGAKIGSRAKARWSRLPDNVRNEIEVDDSEGIGIRPRHIPDVITHLPREKEKLKAYLRENPEFDQDEWIKTRKRDDWNVICRDEQQLTKDVLFELATEGHWLNERWKEALTQWTIKEGKSEDQDIAGSAIEIIKKLQNAPDVFLKNTLFSLCSWIRHYCRPLADNDKAVFLEFCKKLLTLSQDESPPENYDAANTPSGAISEALWVTLSKADEGLPEQTRAMFSHILDNEGLNGGKTSLASIANFLYLADKEWTCNKLVPLFSFKDAGKSEQALALWRAYFFRNQWYQPFILELKDEFLSLSQPDYYERLKNSRYIPHLLQCALVTCTGGEKGKAATNQEGISCQEVKKCFSALNEDGLMTSLNDLSKMVDSIDKDNIEAYVDNCIIPFFEKIWPKNAKNNKNEERFTDRLKISLARFCITNDSIFTILMNKQTISPFLKGFDGSFLNHMDKEVKSIVKKTPAQWSIFLNLVKKETFEFRSILEQSLKLNPELNNCENFKNLYEEFHRG